MCAHNVNEIVLMIAQFFNEASIVFKPFASLLNTYRVST